MSEECDSVTGMENRRDKIITVVHSKRYTYGDLNVPPVNYDRFLISCVEEFFNSSWLFEENTGTRVFTPKVIKMDAHLQYIGRKFITEFNGVEVPPTIERYTQNLIDSNDEVIPLTNIDQIIPERLDRFSKSLDKLFPNREGMVPDSLMDGNKNIILEDFILDLLMAYNGINSTVSLGSSGSGFDSDLGVSFFHPEIRIDFYTSHLNPPHEFVISRVKDSCRIILGRFESELRKYKEVKGIKETLTISTFLPE